MIRRILYWIVAIPIALITAFSLTNIATGLLTGEVSLVTVVVDHKFIIAIIGTWLLVRYFNPFRKK